MVAYGDIASLDLLAAHKFGKNKTSLTLFDNIHNTGEKQLYHPVLHGQLYSLIIQPNLRLIGCHLHICFYCQTTHLAEKTGN